MLRNNLCTILESLSIGVKEYYITILLSTFNCELPTLLLPNIDTRGASFSVKSIYALAFAKNNRI